VAKSSRGIKGENKMKKFFVGLLAIVLFAVPVFGQNIQDDILDTALYEISQGTEWVLVSTISNVYSEVTTAYDGTAGKYMVAGTGTVQNPASLTALQADDCSVNATDDYELESYVGTGGGRAIILCADNVTFTDDLASGSATVIGICVHDGVDTVLGCTDITSTSVTDGDTITYDGNAKFVLADIVDAP